jgi:hypothetical protein
MVFTLRKSRVLHSPAAINLRKTLIMQIYRIGQIAGAKIAWEKRRQLIWKLTTKLSLWEIFGAIFCARFSRD